MRFALLSDRDIFDPLHWRLEALIPSPDFAGWWELDLDNLALGDGTWEYEFILDNDQNSPVPVPWAQSINGKEAQMRVPAALIPACGTTPRYVDE
jgi:hypothetical protein